MIGLLIIVGIIGLVVVLVIRRKHKITKRNILKRCNVLLNGELNYVFGMPGSGKSTLLAAVAQCAYEMGIPCYSSHPIRHTYKFQGFQVQYPVGSIFLLDEIYDYVGSGTNRGILPPETAMFFKEFRHSRYTIWACSQEADDVARRIRGVVTQAWNIVNVGGCSELRKAEIKEVKDLAGDKFELESDSIVKGFFTDYRLKRKHFYDDFDSYCRRTYKEHSTFESW